MTYSLQQAVLIVATYQQLINNCMLNPYSTMCDGASVRWFNLSDLSFLDIPTSLANQHQTVGVGVVVTSWRENAFRFAGSLWREELSITHL